MEEVIPAIQGCLGCARPRCTRASAGCVPICARCLRWMVRRLRVLPRHASAPTTRRENLGAWKMSTASQTFVHAVTPEILRALSRTCAMVCLVVHTVIWRPSVTRRGHQSSLSPGRRRQRCARVSTYRGGLAGAKRSHMPPSAYANTVSGCVHAGAVQPGLHGRWSGRLRGLLCCERLRPCVPVHGHRVAARSASKRSAARVIG